MTGPRSPGDLPWLGGVPERTLDALEIASATARSLIVASCPDDLIAGAAIDELTAAIDLAGAFDRREAAEPAAGPLASEIRTARARRSTEPAWPPAIRAASSGSRTAWPAVADREAGLAPRAADAAAARAWLVAKATRAGAPSALDRPIATTGAALDPATGAPERVAEPAPDPAADRLDAASDRPRRRSAPPGAPANPAWSDRRSAAVVPGSRPSTGTTGDRLAAVLDRIGAPVRATSPAKPAPRTFGELGSAATNPAPAARDPVRGAAWTSGRPDPGLAPATERPSAASDAATASPDRAAARATSIDRAPSDRTPSRTATAADAMVPAPYDRAPSRTATAADAMVPAPYVAPPEAALAAPPGSPLRRFALLAEAAAPMPPAQVEATAPLGPRPVVPLGPPPAAALDDVELADGLLRILRREARRDGIELEPPP